MNHSFAIRQTHHPFQHQLRLVVVLLFHIDPVGKADDELVADEVGLGKANTCSTECAKYDLCKSETKLSKQASTEEGQKVCDPADLIDQDVCVGNVVEEARRRRKAEQSYMIRTRKERKKNRACGKE